MKYNPELILDDKIKSMLCLSVVPCPFWCVCLVSVPAQCCLKAQGFEELQGMWKEKAWASAATWPGLCLSCSMNGTGPAGSAQPALHLICLEETHTDMRQTGQPRAFQIRSSGQTPSCDTGIRSGPRSTVDNGDQTKRREQSSSLACQHR